MEVSQSEPSLLLHHDGELADVRQLLEELATPFREQLGAAVPGEDPSAFDVVIATPRRILERRPGRQRLDCCLIAVLNGDSRTLRAQLRRMHVELIVRRPVHPAALRLLLLHALYRGPERRRRERVSVGAEVRFRQRLLSRAATLAELSLNGARLLTRHAVAQGRRLKLRLGPEVTGGRPLRLTASVLRCGPAADEPAGFYVMALRFEALDRKSEKRLAEVFEVHRAGPATLRQPVVAEPPVPRLAPEAPARVTRLEPAAEDTLPAETDTERRRGQRHSYDRRVVALGEQATRVLLGRDISAGGMRVDPNPGLAVGGQLRLALHGLERSEPFVVDARVERDDGESGLVLRFGALDDASVRVLTRLLDHLPAIEARAGGPNDEATVVVSEILERQSA